MWPQQILTLEMCTDQKDLSVEHNTTTCDLGVERDRSGHVDIESKSVEDRSAEDNERE